MAWVTLLGPGNMHPDPVVSRVLPVVCACAAVAVSTWRLLRRRLDIDEHSRALLWLAGGLIALIFWAGATWQSINDAAAERRYVSEALGSGRATVVAGPVTSVTQPDLSPCSSPGYFDVGAKRFEFSRCAVHENVWWLVSKPWSAVRPGAYLRVTSVDDDIVTMEIRR